MPTPSKLSVKPLLIKGATVHVGNGYVFKYADVMLRNGQIERIDTFFKDQDFTVYEIINTEGKHVYPGLIAPNTNIGLNEIDAIRSTRDYNEVGENNANIRSIIAYNTDSKITPTIRSNGILLAQLTPTGGSISGNSSIVQLDAWNWEDAAYATDNGVHLNMPALFNRPNRFAAFLGPQPVAADVCVTATLAHSQIQEWAASAHIIWAGAYRRFKAMPAVVVWLE